MLLAHATIELRIPRQTFCFRPFSVVTLRFTGVDALRNQFLALPFYGLDSSRENLPGPATRFIAEYTAL